MSAQVYSALTATFALALLALLVVLIITSRRKEISPQSAPRAEFKTDYPWLNEIVRYQRNGLRKYVPVENCEFDLSPLSNGKRYFEITFHVRNYSMFYVSIPMAKYDPVKGAIRFKGDPLSGEAKLGENRVTGLEPYGRSYFKIWQWVNPDEAKEIPETLEKVGNLFDFSEAIVYMRADEFPDDTAAKLDLMRAMQNTELENKVIQLEGLRGQDALEFGEWRKYSDIVFRLNLLYGMALQAKHTIEFPGNTPLPKNVLEYLSAHIDSTIHQCLGAAARDSYFEHVPPVPDGNDGQDYWISFHCSRLEVLIEQQHRQLIAHKATTQHL